jgi:hypothetical protein
MLCLNAAHGINVCVKSSSNDMLKKACALPSLCRTSAVAGTDVVSVIKAIIAEMAGVLGML